MSEENKIKKKGIGSDGRCDEWTKEAKKNLK